MLPVLFSIGNISVSSFGAFLAFGFLLGIFLIWRLARAWDLDEEKTLDLTLLTLLGGVLGARVYFALEHWGYFINAPLNLILINKMPGFSIWGGFLGGWLTLYYFSRRFKINFWQLADIAAVGFLGGLILSNVGCFLGGCSAGVPSKTFFAVTMVGLLGKRWPVQLIEALLLTVVLARIWSQATHFHQRGKIVSAGLISIGFIKLAVEPLKQNHSGLIFSLVLLVLGLTVFYRITRQNPITHIKNLLISWIKFIIDPADRKRGVQNVSKTWYNYKTSFGWKLRNFKKLLRRLNVKFS